MLEINLRYEDGSCRTMRLQAPIYLGRSTECALRIGHWRVGKQHAFLSESGGDLTLKDLGTLIGTTVNGKRITEHAPLLPEDKILIGPCLIQVRRLLQFPNNLQSIVSLPPDVQIKTSAEAEQIEHNQSVIQNLTPQSSSIHSDWVAHQRRLHSELLEALDLRRRDIANMSDQMLRAEAQRLLAEIVQKDQVLSTQVDRDRLCKEVLDEAVGLGPLESLLADPTITEIMVNRYDEIYIEREGKLFAHTASFSSEQAVLGVIERIVSPIGRRIDESSPMVDARLADGSRVNAIIPPIALKGASLTIRKFPSRRLEMTDLIRAGSIDSSMAQFLCLCVEHRKNIVVSGGTGSGKTTLLNILSNTIPAAERIVTIEDAAELRLNHAHLVSLEARPNNLEGRGRIDIRNLVRNALRMRPDRIVVGECRGAEAFDMLAAMNTGHEGSLTTLHANTPRDALGRLETMILMAGMDLPLTAIREHIASSIDLLVQQSRLSNGRRVVTAIVELTGLESGRFQLQTLFQFDRTAQGGFRACNLMPSFIDEWRELGIKFDSEMFYCRSVDLSQEETPKHSDLLNLSKGLSWSP